MSGDRGAVSVVGAFAAVGAAVWGVARYAAGAMARQESYRVPLDTVGGPWTEAWDRWDGHWYLSIAREGYAVHQGRPTNVVYFPAYPLLARWVGRLVGDPLPAALAVAAVAGLAAALALWWWAPRVGVTGPARWCTLGALFLWPWAYHLYGSVYAESLFLALAVGAFLCLERDRLAAAAVLAAVASATRPVGLAVTIGLAVEVVRRRGGWRHLRRGDAVLAVGPLGLLGYLAFCAAAFGDPLLPFTGQGAPGWEQGLSVRNALKLPLWEDLAAGGDVLPVRLLLLCGILTLGAIALLPVVWRRFGPGYGAYSAVVVLVPAVASKDFQGMGRYLLLAFPAFAVVGEAVARRSPVVRLAVVGLSSAFLLTFTALFATGHYTS